MNIFNIKIFATLAFIIIIYSTQTMQKRPLETDTTTVGPQEKKAKFDTITIEVDNQQFTMPRQTAITYSQTLKLFLEEIQPSEQVITLSPSIISPNTMKEVVVLLNLLQDNKDLHDKALLDMLDKKLSVKDWLNFMLAVNYLDIPIGIDWVARSRAHLLAYDPSQETAIMKEINNTKEIKNDLKEFIKTRINYFYILLTAKELGLKEYSLQEYLDYQPALIKEKWDSDFDQLILNNFKINSLKGLNTFENSAEVDKLDVSHNQLKTVPATIFNTMKSLNILYLNDNQIQELTSHVFDALNELKYLHLENNQLKKLPQEIFSNLHELEILHLNNNQLAQIPQSLFDNLFELQNLSLQNNQFTEFPDRIFNNLTKLERLDLSNNKLKKLPTGIVNLTNLKKLYLEGNQFDDATKDAIKKALPNTAISF
jgi:Leucine-rich repeat (LRR) protein